MIDTVMSELENFWLLYQDYALIIGITFFISFLTTPFTGVLSTWLKAYDNPAHLRKKDDNTRDRRIHKAIMPNLGGLGIVLAFAVGVVFANHKQYLNINDQQLLHILLGLLVVTIVGFWDSWRDVSAGKQLLMQLLVAIIVVLAGIRIDFIEILQIKVNLDLVTYNFDIFGIALSISPLADLVTIIWIVGLINAINWVSGIDGLSGGMSFFASMTLLFIGVKYETMFAAVLASILAGGILGYLPYNMPPAKTFNGTIGDMTQGYMLAILAIISGAKLSTSIILLAVPIIDAIWVLVGRLVRHRKEIHSPLDLLRISDKTHLHHRFLDIGFSVRQTLALEMLVFFFFCVAAYYIAGFSDETVMLMIALLACLTLFVFIAIAQSGFKKRRQEREERVEESVRAKVKIDEETPEEKYAY